jgi:hypothetical protein
VHDDHLADRRRGVARSIDGQTVAALRSPTLF